MNISSHYADEISDQLATYGAVSVTWQDAGDQSIYEPMPGQLIVWDEVILSALYEDVSSLNLINDYVTQLKNQQCLKAFEIREVQEQNWVKANQEQLEPMQFGKRLWICPNGNIPDPQAANVLFNPGLAFGTGTHPTTALCLEWLDQHIEGGEHLLDYGCGSGILAVAALKLGAAHAIGVDHDIQALDACRMNAELNHFSPSNIEVYFPQDLPLQQVDVLIANILAQPLISLAPYFSLLVKPHGQLVLSGILREQAQEVLSAYQQWFSMEAPLFKEEWVRLEGRRSKVL